MFQIQPVKSTACATVYRVVQGDDEYMVKLWIINGGQGALAFERSARSYGEPDPVCTRRFETTSLWRKAVWESGPGKYVHQHREGDGSLTGCPTIENALPRRTDDFLEWLEWAIPERVRLIAEAHEKKRLEDIGKAAGRPHSTWGTERVPDEPPRLLNCGSYGPDTWRTTGAWLAHSMKGAKSDGAVRLNGAITIGIAALRTYCKAIGHDVIDLTIYPAEAGNAATLVVTTVPDPASPLRAHRSTFKDGAFDKYQAANGHTCAVTFSDRVRVALDNRKHRPGKYCPFTLDLLEKAKVTKTTVDLIVVQDNASRTLTDWPAFETDTPGLCVVLEPEYNELLEVDGQNVWQPWRGHWQIIHMGCGLPVRTYRIKTRSAALQIAASLADLLDWTQTQEQINDELNDRIKRMAVSDGINERYAAGGATGLPGM